MKKPKQWCFPPKFICVFFYLHEVDSTREQLQTKQTPNNDKNNCKDSYKSSNILFDRYILSARTQ